MKVVVIGAGLAGSEAAYYLAQKGVKVILYEMRPVKKTPVHQTGNFAELVCSNSFRSLELTKAAGLLKEEMRLLGSLVLKVAEECRVLAGVALAVDRKKFSSRITEILTSHPNIKVIREEITKLNLKQPTIIATGPLTSSSLEKELARLTGSKSLYFYDAASPILTRDSLNFKKIFLASRYNKGEGNYLNCPMNKTEYERFWEELISAETVPLKEFEKEIYFSGCLPIEVMAKKGKDTLRFGPLKPVGLINHLTKKKPYAVVQLRQDDFTGSLYSMVGFQTNLKWKEQERVFRMVPGLERAEFVRFGVMHRNTYLNSPQVLKNTLEFRDYPGFFLAGQISGVEGYIESAATGIIAAMNLWSKFNHLNNVVLPLTTALGSLINYVTNPHHKNFQPMHVSFGLMPPFEKKLSKKERFLAYSQRALNDLKIFLEKRKELL